MTKELVLAYRNIIPILPPGFVSRIVAMSALYPEKRFLRISDIIGKLYSKVFWRSSLRWKQYSQFQTPSSICNAGGMSLLRLIRIVKPNVILELGSGFSTLIIASNLNRRKIGSLNAPKIVSVEDAKVWFESQSETIYSSGLSEVVKLVYAPTSNQTIYGQNVQTYDMTKIIAALDGARPEIVFVDGPPAIRYGGPGRLGSLLQAISLTDKGGWILLHDALRSDEYNIVKQVLIQHEHLVEQIGIILVGQGISVLRKIADN